MKIIKKIAISSLVLAAGLFFKGETEVSAEKRENEYDELLNQIIQSETEHGLTGAQLSVYKDGELVKDDSYGYTNNYKNVYGEDDKSVLDQVDVLPEDERTPVDSETMFDLASNTKMYATVYAMQKLASEGKVTLDTKIKDIYSEFTEEGNENGWKDQITVEHALSHYAGFAPDPQYHNEKFNQETNQHDGVNELFSQDREKTFDMIMKTPIQTEPGTSWAYSDVDMMLAGFIVETLSGQRLDEYVKENFYDVLGLDRITFNPLENGFLPTETSSSELHGNTRDGQVLFENARTEIVTGEVHDEKAYYSMDGVSGHAGLFGNSKQIAYLAQMMFSGELAGQQFFSQDTLQQFTTPAALRTQTAGGWRRKSEEGGAETWFSKFAPAGTIGHTGWTGTLTLIDPLNRVTLALLTNSRNTPIMGPDANDFYTKNLNVSSYGLVAELVYRSLGLGTDDLTSADQVLEDLIWREIPDDLNEVSSSKRNVMRSLLSVLKLRATNNDNAADLLSDESIQAVIAALETTEAKDLKFLVVTKVLAEEVKAAEEKLNESYTEETLAELETVIRKADQLLSGDYTQAEVDELLVELMQTLESLEKLEEADDCINEEKVTINNDKHDEKQEEQDASHHSQDKLPATGEQQLSLFVKIGLICLSIGVLLFNYDGQLNEVM